jgi:hypothetical protein
VTFRQSGGRASARRLLARAGMLAGDTGLSARTGYSYKVVTINGAGLTAASTAVKVTTP